MSFFYIDVDGGKNCLSKLDNIFDDPSFIITSLDEDTIFQLQMYLSFIGRRKMVQLRTKHREEHGRQETRTEKSRWPPF